MKIKTKKQFTLPQLIEWAWDNGIDSRTFKSPKGGDITFDEYGDVVDVYSIKPNDTFTVEVEEVVDEDTVISRLGVMYMDTGFTTFENDYINNEFPLDSIQAFYIINDDLTLTLIWTHEEGMVE